MLKVKGIKPLFNKVVTTRHLYEDDKSNGGIVIKQSGTIKEYQTVVSVGSMVKDIKVGDIVMINPARYRVTKHQEGSMKNGVISDNMTIGVNFPTVEIEGKTHLLISDSDIDYIIIGEEVEESSLILPRKKSVIV